VQTGVAEEPGDTDTVAPLADCLAALDGAPAEAG